MKLKISGLKTRLILFGVAAALPILGLMAYEAWLHKLENDGKARAFAGDLVDTVAREQQIIFALGEKFQSALALNPVIAEPKDRPACNRALKQAVSASGIFTAIGLYSAAGDPLCLATAEDPVAAPVSIADHPVFRQVLAEKREATSNFRIGGACGKAVVMLAHPILDASGNVSQVLMAGLDLVWLGQALDRISAPHGTNVVIVDGNGIVLTPEKWSGRSVADHPVFKTVTGIAGRHDFEAVGIDGVERIFSARPLHKTPNGSLYAWVAVPKSHSLEMALVDFLETSLFVFLAFLAFFVVIWRVGSQQVLAPLRRLKDAAQRLGESDPGARTRLPYERDEIGQLALTFDEMADSIESRELALRQSREALQKANRALRALSAINHAVVRAPDEPALLEQMCRIAVVEGGYRSAWVGRAEDDAEKTVTVLASAGMPEEYLQALAVTWADDVRGRGPAGTAIRENRPFAIHSISSNSRFAPWRALALKHGYEAALGLPVSVAGKVWGVLCLYAVQREIFEEEEIALLAEMAADLGFGIEMLRLRLNEAAAQKALVRVNEELEARVRERTQALEQANRELESFSYSASHDLRAPLRSMAGFAQILNEDYSHVLDAEGRSHLERIRKAASRMGQLIDDLLQLAQISRAEVKKVSVDLSALARDVCEEIATVSPRDGVAVDIEAQVIAEGDPALLRIVLQNLHENAWKYTGQREDARIAFGTKPLPDGGMAYYVKDNGSGFDMAHADHLFQPFVRLHSGEEYPGTGIGLATVARVVERHGGRVWCEAQKGQGATFLFSLG